MTEVAERPLGMAVLPIPGADQVDDLTAWAQVETDALAEIGAVADEPGSRGAMTLLLMALAGADLPSGFAWRYLVVAGPLVAPVVVTVGFQPVVQADGAAWDDLIGADLPAPAGRDVSVISMNDLDLKQCLRFRLAPSEDGSETDALWVAGAIVARRELPHGTTDVLFTVDTPEIDTLFGMLPVIHDLLTGDLLLDHTARAQQIT